MPFRYGIATPTALTHVVVQAWVWVNGVDIKDNTVEMPDAAALSGRLQDASAGEGLGFI